MPKIKKWNPQVIFVSSGEVTRFVSSGKVRRFVSIGEVKCFVSSGEVTCFVSSGVVTCFGWVDDGKMQQVHATDSSEQSASTDLPDLLSLPVPIVHCSWEVFKSVSCIGTELLYIGSSCSSCLCFSMWKGPHEYVTYKFVLTSPTVSCMSGLSNFDNFRGGW